jgi:hypothetical protein
MTTAQIVNFQSARNDVRADTSAHANTAAATTHGICTLASGAALSLTPRAPTALRIAEGQAWVTLDDGPHGARGEAAGDVFLHAGQTLWVATGQHAVVEPLGGRRVQYRLTGLSTAHSRTTWWQRVWGGAPSQASPQDACCA